MSTPDASAFGPDRLELYARMNDLVSRTELYRNLEALCVARLVADGAPQAVIGIVAERFCEADMHHKTAVARFIAFSL